MLGAKPVERLATVGHGVRLVAFGAKVLDDARRQMGVVLDHENAVGLWRQIAHDGSAGATGQVSTKRRALPHALAVRADTAAGELHQTSHDEEAEAGAVVAAAAARVQARELLE